MDKPSRHVLVVTGPERDRLFERFCRLYTGRVDVEVVKDRRRVERRRAERGPANMERRVGERRQSRAEWVFPPN